MIYRSVSFVTVTKKMSDAYEVVGGSLKLKGVKDGGVKKKLAFFKIVNRVKYNFCKFLKKSHSLL